jgi:hypothetical protein
MSHIKENLAHFPLFKSKKDIKKESLLFNASKHGLHLQRFAVASHHALRLYIVKK